MMEKQKQRMRGLEKNERKLNSLGYVLTIPGTNTNNCWCETEVFNSPKKLCLNSKRPANIQAEPDLSIYLKTMMWTHAELVNVGSEPSRKTQT